MSSSTANQDASLSAASFLASISAESSTSFGTAPSGSTSAAAASAPALPISAKASLIDAQIDALEGRIEQTITSHADQLRQRAASTRSVDRDLNQLWRSINQTSSRLVTVGPQLAPIASEYHDALAQSSKQGLLISVLSDLLAATRHLERLEQLQRSSDLDSLRAELPKAAQAMQPFRSRSALHNLPAVAELRARFERLQNQCKHPEPTSHGIRSPSQSQQALLRVSLDAGSKEQRLTPNADTAQGLSPALNVLESARALIVPRGSEGGWKEVRIELDAPVPPPSIPVPVAAPQSSVDSGRSSLEARTERLLRDDLMPESASLTRNSSSSSNTNARNRHKPKLGARVIRPQDQLGSGPFNAEDTPLDEDGWGLDDDDEEPSLPSQTLNISQTAQSAHASAYVSQPIHPSVSALARDSRHSSPSSSIVMQSSMSSCSSQRSAFAVQEPESHEETSASNGTDAWDLGDEGDDAEADAWELDDEDAPQELPPPPTEARALSPNPVGPVHAPVREAAAPAAEDAWGLEDEAVEAGDDPWETQEQLEDVIAAPPALQEHTAAQPASISGRDTANVAAPEPTSKSQDSRAARVSESVPDLTGDPWETQEKTLAPAPASPAASKTDDLSLSATSEHNGAETPSPKVAGNAEASRPEATPDPTPDVDVDPWEAQEENGPLAGPAVTSRVDGGAPTSSSMGEAADKSESMPANEVDAMHLASTGSSSNAEPDAWAAEEQEDQATVPITASQADESMPSEAKQAQDDAGIPPPFLAVCPPHPSGVDTWEMDEKSAEAAAAEDPWETSEPPDENLADPSSTPSVHEEATAPALAPAQARNTESSSQDTQPPATAAQAVPLHTAIPETQHAAHHVNVSMPVKAAQDGPQEPLVPKETVSREGPTKAAPQHVAATAEDNMEEEPEEDAWGFEEGSSASEADRAEFAPITPLQKTTASDEPKAVTSPAGPAQVPSKEVEEAKTLPKTLDSARSIPKAIVTPQTRQPEPIASPPSPTGWGQDFSDSESTGVSAAMEQQTTATKARPQDRSISSSRSVSTNSKGGSGSTNNEASKLPEPLPKPAAVVKEECTISQRSLDLIHLAENTMSLVISLLHDKSQSDGVIDDVEALAGAVFKIFELHRALMPVAHGEVLRDVPSLAMQFFNDCEYLARELARLVSEKGEDVATAWISHDAEAAKRWKTKELPKLEQEAALTRSLGQRWFEAQMTAQTKILLDTLMEADGFARTFDDQRFARCERCIKQVVQTLHQLAKAWQPVLVASRFHAAIGRLVDLVFQKVLHDVLDLEDIGESESEKIASLVKTLGSLESLFVAEAGTEQSAAPLWVPSWFKTSYLIEILTGSLVDIEFLAFEAGALVDYSRKELTGLIKALFADTPNRSKLLRRIEGASVDVLAH